VMPIVRLRLPAPSDPSCCEPHQLDRGLANAPGTRAESGGAERHSSDSAGTFHTRGTVGILIPMSYTPPLICCRKAPLKRRQWARAFGARSAPHEARR
jgi:hypothetical protein